MFDTGRAEVRLGRYVTAPASALVDATLFGKAQEARRSLSARMFPLGREDVDRRFPPGEYHVSLKVDGEFSVLVFDGERAITVNPYGTVRAGLPVLEEAASLMKAAGLKSAQFATELYVARPDGKRPRVHDVVRVARKPESEADLESLRLAVFDVLAADGKVPGAKFAESWALIGKVFGAGKRIRPVEAVSARTAKDIALRFDEWVGERGEEGLVVRSDSQGIAKVKPRHTLDVVVVGFSEGVGDRAGLLHDLLVAVVRQDRTFHLLGRVGGGFSEEDRRNILSDMKDIAVGSDYIETSSDSVAYRFVRPEWVIEVSVLDLVSQSSRGAPIDRMVLSWDKSASKWVPARRLPLASPISPVFVRRREDKQPVAADAGIRQVADLVDVPQADRDARSMAFAKSQVVRRKVWTKVMKGQKMVRKLLLWKTNKQEEPGYYDFVVYAVDFSPNRKTPMEREVRATNSQAQAEALWDGFVKDYVKGGWAEAA